MEILHVEAQDRARRKGEQGNEGFHFRKAALLIAIGERNLRWSDGTIGWRASYDDVDGGHFVIYV